MISFLITTLRGLNDLLTAGIAITAQADSTYPNAVITTRNATA